MDQHGLNVGYGQNRCLELKSKNKTKQNCCMENRQQENDRGQRKRVIFNAAKNGERQFS